jgi:hypothetical protein
MMMSTSENEFELDPLLLLLCAYETRQTIQTSGCISLDYFTAGIFGRYYQVVESASIFLVLCLKTFILV